MVVGSRPFLSGQELMYANINRNLITEAVCFAERPPNHLTHVFPRKEIPMATVKCHLSEALQSIFLEYEMVLASFHSTLKRDIRHSTSSAELANNPIPESLNTYSGLLTPPGMFRSWEVE